MSTIDKIPAFWRRRSLRFWLATGMLMSLAPIFTFALTGYFLYHGAVIQPLVEVASKQRHILQPLQSVQMSLWDVSESVVDFAIDGEDRHKIAYQQQVHQIDDNLEKLTVAMEDQKFDISNINEAKDQWRELVTLPNTILSGETNHVNAIVGEDIEEFELLINRLAHQLGTVHDTVRIKNEKTHQQALASLTLSEYLAGAGLLLSIIFSLLGVVVINRSLVSSMDQLASGSMRFSDGDREHQVEVHIPRELANVADAFNQMMKQIREQEDTLERMAITDGLTGLYNRREFDRLLGEEVRRAERYGKSVSLIIGDIDHFKTFNDSYGHQAGDEAIRSVGQTLSENLREADKACRFGGEEFVIILPECDAEAARQVAERVRNAVEARVFHIDGERTAQVTISLGVATSAGNSDTLETLLKRADFALYKAKEHGRNRVKSGRLSHQDERTS
ncbi:sensor domain-containing diguanylate cyclase [Halomonas maura]|uniref:sensor domain-containing diguanylate cyclase n=1 Tax=Halomonas maura TaxID=117606 RepID=UPI0025B2E4CF|nr:sensor domain-containing diguanylate cyclase [Halomonas maura]MDN3556253.1 sensor domain-containing diguanylate cyclase [Halomonas maura]